MNRRGFFSAIAGILSWIPLYRERQSQAPRWIGPEPTWIPSQGIYLCHVLDGPKLREMIDGRKLPPAGGGVAISKIQHVSIPVNCLIGNYEHSVSGWTEYRGQRFCW
jgi:hypothetical protein